MTPVPAPADKRFRRAHASPARKRPSLHLSWPRAARAAAVIALVSYGVYRATGLVLSADALTITRITVNGNSRMSRGEVLSLLDGLQGQSMVTVNLDRWRQKLLTSPWVSEAAIKRVRPGTVHVVIAERRPMAVGRIGDALYLIDERGSVIDEFGPNYAELDLPIIDGLAAPPSSGGGLLIDETRAALAERLLAALQARPDLAGQVSQIDVTDPHDAMVILKDDTAMVRVGDERFVDRLQAYLDLRPALRERIPDIDYADLRFDERVYVRPRARAGGRGKGTGGN